MISTLNLMSIGDFGVIKQINDSELSNYFIEMGLSMLKAKGLKNVMAVIYADNIASVALFKKLGFTQWGLLPAVCNVKGVLKDVVILGKSL